MLDINGRLIEIDSNKIMRMQLSLVSVQISLSFWGQVEMSYRQVKSITGCRIRQPH